MYNPNKIYNNQASEKPQQELTPKQMHRELVKYYFNDQEKLIRINEAKEKFDAGHPEEIEALYKELISEKGSSDIKSIDIFV